MIRRCTGAGHISAGAIPASAGTSLVDLRFCCSKDLFSFGCEDLSVLCTVAAPTPFLPWSGKLSRPCARLRSRSKTPIPTPEESNTLMCDSRPRTEEPSVEEIFQQLKPSQEIQTYLSAFWEKVP